jgi:hypothetical protein
MECRICLTDENPELMIQPCKCKGTSAYIHQKCLENYIRNYSSTCAVCKTPFYTLSIVHYVWIGMLAVGGMVYSKSEPALLSIAIGGFIFNCLRIGLDEKLIIVLSCMLLISSLTPIEIHIYIGITSVVLCSSFIAIRYFPRAYIALLCLIVSASIYGIVVLFYIYEYLDNFGKTIIITSLYLSVPEIIRGLDRLYEVAW